MEVDASDIVAALAMDRVTVAGDKLMTFPGPQGKRARHFAGSCELWKIP